MEGKEGKKERRFRCRCRQVIGKKTLQLLAKTVELVEILDFTPSVLDALGEDDRLFTDGTRGDRETGGDLYLREAADFNPKTLEKLASLSEVRFVKGFKIQSFRLAAERILRDKSSPHRCFYCLYRTRRVLLVKSARDARRAIAAQYCSLLSKTATSQSQTPVLEKAPELSDTSRCAPA